MLQCRQIEGHPRNEEEGIRCQSIPYKLPRALKSAAVALKDEVDDDGK